MQKLYTADSYAELAKQIKAGEAVYNNEDATQEEVDNAVKAIKEAKAKLALKGNGPGNKAEPKPDKEVPKTADGTPILWVFGSACAALLALLGIKRKRV